MRSNSLFSPRTLNTAQTRKHPINNDPDIVHKRTKYPVPISIYICTQGDFLDVLSPLFGPKNAYIYLFYVRVTEYTFSTIYLSYNLNVCPVATETFVIQMEILQFLRKILFNLNTRTFDVTLMSKLGPILSELLKFQIAYVKCKIRVIVNYLAIITKNV